MNNMYRKLLLTLCAVAALGITTGAYADPGLATPPGIKVPKGAVPIPRYETVPGSNLRIEIRKGTVDTVDTTGGTIVIDDMSYSVSKTTPVSRGGIPMGISGVKKNMQVELVYLNGALQEIRVVK